MERLTIDEVIAHCKRHTERMENHSGRMQLEETPIGNSNMMKQYWEHRQVAEWLEQLKDYKDAEEQGLLLRLPCKVGDKVYVKLSSYCESKYAEAEVVDFTYFISCGFCIVVTSKHFDKQAIPFSEFGKTVFPNKEEAEQALKRMESE